MNARFASLALGLSVSLGACADLSDEEGSDGVGGKADEINPVDNENLAKLKVIQPTMTGQPAPYAMN